MSSEAITASTFIREYTRELHNKNAAIFAGAGLSMDSGYVDWPGLLRELIQDLGLDPEKEHDLVTLAQYHCNQAGGSKTRLTQAIFTHFAPTRTPTKNHQILARLPIYTYWTTNYDKLIEKALEEAKKFRM
jgi:NAD-dependent SIR2 family protein deacetylase